MATKNKVIKKQEKEKKEKEKLRNIDKSVCRRKLVEVSLN